MGQVLRGRGWRTVSSRVRLLACSPPCAQLSVGGTCLIKCGLGGDCSCPIHFPTSTLHPTRPTPPPWPPRELSLPAPTTTRPAAAGGSPVLRFADHRGGLYIGDAGRVGATLAQPAPLVPKPEEGDDPDMRAALALSIAEEEANWPQLTVVIRTSVMEEEARQAVEDTED
ncbi:hypothetical protein QYE76_041993 [Lolium multiflorum]|uniref:Uncharacterized protein n=1 Tax=Lolium multiflorum TaxID=4521 RepID=A0AAD8TEK2_LOLMU|nr:hypothetical protein QYE76_041993 [Lolium multiflorum]